MIASMVQAGRRIGSRCTLLFLNLWMVKKSYSNGTWVAKDWYGQRMASLFKAWRVDVSISISSTTTYHWLPTNIPLLTTISWSTTTRIHSHGQCQGWWQVYLLHWSCVQWHVWCWWCCYGSRSKSLLFNQDRWPCCAQCTSAGFVSWPWVRRTIHAQCKPINSAVIFPFFLSRIIRGIAYDTNPDTARAREALWTVNKVINLFKLDDPKSIQQCKSVTSQFLSVKNGSPKGQHQISAVGNCHIGKWNFIFFKGVTIYLHLHQRHGMVMALWRDQTQDCEIVGDSSGSHGPISRICLYRITGMRKSQLSCKKDIDAYWYARLNNTNGCVNYTRPCLIESRRRRKQDNGRLLEG